MVMGDYDYADSAAARMLSNGLRNAASERRLSVRQIGKLLQYKQAVVLSHMANGRVPIPLDRALDIAGIVGIPGKEFLEAVLEQRHPKVDWSVLRDPADHFATELELLAGRALNELDEGHKRVLRDVVRDPTPEERWLTVHELSVLKLMREIFPDIRRLGLSATQQKILRGRAELAVHPALHDSAAAAESDPGVSRF